MPQFHSRRWMVPWLLFPALILILNLGIGAGLFTVEYSGHLESNEGMFIAIARNVAAHPGDLMWWPEWDCGMAFQNTYSPLVPLLAGGFSRVSGHSPALAYHQVAAAFFCLGPVFVFLMAWAITRKSAVSFFAAVAYSLFSPCAMLLPSIGNDVGGALNSRRLQILAYYGEGPHTVSMALVPLAILFLYLALAHGRLRDKILAGVLGGAAILANAFGAVILLMAGAALVATYGAGRFWKCLGSAAAIGGLAYGWICPLMPPSVIAAIRMNSPTVGGDYHFTARSAAGMAVLAAGFLAIWLVTRGPGWRDRLAHLRLFLLFAWLATGTVAMGELARVYVVPQPHRYQIAMDMALCVLAASSAAELLGKTRPRTAQAVVVLLLVAVVVQAPHAVRYARRQIQRADIAHTAPYRLARWMDANMHGARVMVSGSYSFHFNDFTDTPQLHGGQEPMLPNFTMRHATYQIYSGTDTGPSVLWLKALGAHAIAVPGAHSSEYYKPYVNPRKFEGVLAVLWREDDDTIYAVPARSDSLAHVVDAASIVHDRPADGLDTAQLKRFVEALEAPTYPEATWRWLSRHSAAIHAEVAPGQAVSTQITYHPGWHAAANGAAAGTYADGLGLLVVKPPCQGPCDIALSYEGGFEWRAACGVSAATTILVLCLAIGSWRKRRPALPLP